jgi:hypothetical protein
MPRRQLADTPGVAFHIYNRGANRGQIFFEDRNYRFFLERLRGYLESTQGVLLAYCLMPNHFQRVLPLGARPIAQMAASPIIETNSLRREFVTARVIRPGWATNMLA